MPDWRQLSWADRVAWVIGTGFGSGFSPIAPGTAGSAVAGVIFGAAIWGRWYPGFVAVQIVIVALVAIAVGLPVGVWATGRMSTDDNPDPGTAVWDEFVGMWITCLPVASLAFYAGYLPPPYLIVLPFFVFRCLDILKPWPCRRLERLHGGWGIMLDDVAAGIWGGLALSLLALIYVTVRGALGM